MNSPLYTTADLISVAASMVLITVILTVWFMTGSL